MNTQPKQKQSLLSGKGTVEDYEQGKRMFEALAELFARPVVLMVGWEDSLTQEQRRTIEVERLKQIKDSNGKPITEATDYEAMLYISTVSLVQPIGRVATNIYQYLFRRQFPEQAKDILGEHEGRELDQFQEQQELQRLKRWLFKSSLDRQRAKAREEKLRKQPCPTISSQTSPSREQQSALGVFKKSTATK